MFDDRVLSGMRPTGALHLGHYHGVLKNWIKLQHEYQCLFFVADWHALTTHYDTPEVIEANVWEMLIDWLAAGVDPAQCGLLPERGGKETQTDPQPTPPSMPCAAGGNFLAGSQERTLGGGVGRSCPDCGEPD